tara:strand:- start:718 stop:969 length:252 start_codon:yes stop_codon:yes gene_type:complete
VKHKKEVTMKQDFKIDGKSIINFIKSRVVVLENKNNQNVIDLPLIWFMVAMIFLSGFIIVGLIICLLLGFKISLIEKNNSDNY